MRILRDKLSELKKGWYSITPKEAVAISLRYNDDASCRASLKEVAKHIGGSVPYVTKLAKDGIDALGSSRKSDVQDMALRAVIESMLLEVTKEKVKTEPLPQALMQTQYNENDFSTRDIGLVAALMCHGGRPTNVTIDMANRKAKFVFEGQPGMLKKMREFHDDGLMCNAKQLLNYRYDLKSMIYDKCNQRVQSATPVQNFREPSPFRKVLEQLPSRLVEPYDFNHV